MPRRVCTSTSRRPSDSSRSWRSAAFRTEAARSWKPEAAEAPHGLVRVRLAHQQVEVGEHPVLGVVAVGGGQQVDALERAEREVAEGVGDGLEAGDAEQVGGGVAVQGDGEGWAQGGGEGGVVGDGEQAVADQPTGAVGGAEVGRLFDGGRVEALAVGRRGGRGHGAIVSRVAYERGCGGRTGG